MAEVSLPLLLKEFTGGVRKTRLEGETLGEVLAALDSLYPGIEARIHEDGKISPTLALVVDGKIAMKGLNTPVEPDSQVAVLPSFGGG